MIGCSSITNKKGELKPLVLLAAVGVFLIMGTSFREVGLHPNSVFTSANDDIFVKDAINEVSGSKKSILYKTVVEKTKGYEPFDLVVIKENQKPVSLLAYLFDPNKGYIESSKISVKKNTGSFTLDVKDILVAESTNKHYGSRGGIYYTSTSYVRLDDIFYRVDNIKQDDFTIGTYLLQYSLKDKGKITDLTGTYDSYRYCSIEKIK